MKWRLCLLLFLATALNYLDGQTMSIVAPVLQKEMHLGNEALGWLFAVSYYPYTFSQFAVGLILDRSNLRWTYGLNWTRIYSSTTSPARTLRARRPRIRKDNGAAHGIIAGDCKQVNIVLVVSRSGMPLGYEIFVGNRNDVTTLEEIIEQMEAQYREAHRLWVLDRGM